MDAGTLAARLLGSAVIASGRPVAAAFAVQLVAALAIYQQSAALPRELAWIVSPLALGVGLVAALIELFVQHTEGADELLRDLHADKLLAAVAGLPAMATLALLTTVTADVQRDAAGRLVAAGLSEQRAAQLVDAAAGKFLEHVEAGSGAQPLAVGAETEELAGAIRVLEDSQVDLRTKALLLGLALGLQLVMLWLRGEARAFVEDLGFERIWAWLESGGLAVGFVLTLFAPLLLLGFSLLLALLAVGGYLLLRWVSRAIDALRRRSCPHCQASIRVEACRCPACRADVEPTRNLGQTPGSLGRLRAAA